MGTEMVDIYVSPSKLVFRLHKSKLCARIPYFNKMFNGTFKEATENTAYLPEDTPLLLRSARRLDEPSHDNEVPEEDPGFRDWWMRVEMRLRAGMRWCFKVWQRSIVWASCRILWLMR
ncbi:hypothetical protein V8E51_007457 [Hyaloscypha variabilis]